MSRLTFPLCCVLLSTCGPPGAHDAPASGARSSSSPAPTRAHRPVPVPELSVADSNLSSITLAWTRAPGAATYALYAREVSGETERLRVTAGTHFTDDQVHAGHRRFYYVRALGADGGEVGRSNELGATAAGPPNALARTPPMGWSTWNRFHCGVNASLVESMADALVRSGMAGAGYRYVLLDDCWAVGRDADGNIVADPVAFPGGIRPVVDYVHARGLKFGIYTAVGPWTCALRPGSFGHELQDARTYASWGVDAVKEDWCVFWPDAPGEYAHMHDALASTGRDIVFTLSDWGFQEPWDWAPALGNLWRTTVDISDTFQSMTDILDSSSDHAASAGPGHWNDPDMLEVGNGGMTDVEYRTHFSLWALMAAPLIAGNDVAQMTAATAETLMNAEVIAVDQNPLGLQGTKVSDDGSGLQVWARPLQAPGTRAVVLFNRSGSDATLRVAWRDLGLSADAARVRDLWAHAELGTFAGGYQASVPSHGVAMVKVEGQESVPPPGISYVSELDWAYAANGQGPVERDRSNGGRAAFDGQPLSLRGVRYGKGLGVAAESAVRVHLGGHCSRFTAQIGIDDEVQGQGAAVLQVIGDGEELHDSGLVLGTDPAQRVDVDLAGVQDLTLAASGAGAGTDDNHVDWAEAQVTCGP